MPEFIRVTVEHLVDGVIRSSRVHCLDAESDQDRFRHTSVHEGRLTETDVEVEVRSSRSC